MADSIQFHGQEKIRDWVGRVIKETNNIAPMMREIGAILEYNTKHRIDSGVGVDDRPWAQSWRARIQGGTTLRDTSRLYNSITSRVVSNGKDVSIGTNVLYARLMQFGGTIRPKNGKYLTFKTPLGGWVRVKSVTIKPRPYLGVSADDSQEILTTVEEYLERALRDAE